MRLVHRYAILIVFVSTTLWLLTCLLRLTVRRSFTDDSGIALLNKRHVADHLRYCRKEDSLIITKFRPSQCSMLECFNWTKCIGQEEPKVFVYPNAEDEVHSNTYKNILGLLRESAFTPRIQVRPVCSFSAWTLSIGTGSGNALKPLGSEAQCFVCEPFCSARTT